MFPRHYLSHVGGFSITRNTYSWHSIDRFQTSSTNLQGPELMYPWKAFFEYCICFNKRSWLYDGSYLVSIACFWSMINIVKSLTSRWKVRSCKHANADACNCMETHWDKCRWTQTNGDKCRCTEMNARQTASGTWADATPRCIRTLDVCSKTFGMHKTVFTIICVCECLLFLFHTDPVRHYCAESYSGPFYRYY